MSCCSSTTRWSGTVSSSAPAARGLALQVFRTNPAARLYRRLGFRVVAETDAQLQLLWTSISSWCPPGTP